VGFFIGLAAGDTRCHRAAVNVGIEAHFLFLKFVNRQS
jgi:hypothetical protein